MLRFLILAGYVELMMSLQLSGKLDQYINTHYRYLAYLSILFGGLLAIIQLIQWVKQEKNTHTHLVTPFQKISSFILLTLPLFVGFCFPTVSLDASIIDAKGFHFPLAKGVSATSDGSGARTQYLRPDTSYYYNENDYNNMMERIKKKYSQSKKITVTSENYLEVMEMIYDFPNEFIGKTIVYEGFIYTDPEKNKQRAFLFRFGIIHCVADSGVFGLLNELPTNLSVQNNDWYHLEGTLKMLYYKPFNRNLPSVLVTHAEKINKPSNQYVYRAF